MDSTLRLNQIRMKATHNSYQRDEDLTDQMLFWRVRSIELDIHTSSERKHDWKVYHNIPTETAITWLSDAIPLLLGFHNANPLHEVVIVSIDLKDSFDDDHSANDLDALLQDSLGAGRIYSASNLVPKETGVDTAPTWPLLSDLQGKFLFILTTGNLDSSSSHLNQYLDGSDDYTCFVAPEISDTDPLDHTKSPKYKKAVVYNVDLSKGYAKGVARTAYLDGWLCRGFGANDEDTWNTGVSAKVHVLGTNSCNFVEDTWARTDNAAGYPFQILDGTSTDGMTEGGDFHCLKVTSDDIWGGSDSCLFQLFAGAITDGASYTCAIGVPSSHAPDKWGKVGLMARTSKSANSANFAILRTADNYPVRAQARSSDGGDTNSWDLDVSGSAIAGARGDTWVFVRLDISDGGRTVTGSASYDNTHWTVVKKQTFNSPMTAVGVVGSSHTRSEVQYLVLPIAGFPTNSTAVLLGGAQGSLAAGVPIPDARW